MSTDNKNFKDNNRGVPYYNKSFNDSLRAIANKSIAQLSKENSDLLIVSGLHKDDVEKSPIFNFNDSVLTTRNIVGFLSVTNKQGEVLPINIHSRFDANKKQFFLQYMLQRVFCPTILDLQIDTQKDNVLEFVLAMLFPIHLKKAFRQGVFKEYRKVSYNDSNVRGTIDINRHIKQNVPFNGKIAYNCREFTFDTPLLHLIKHTLEYLSSKKWVFDKSSEFNEYKNDVSINIVNYNLKSRARIIKKNCKPIHHPYFTEYEPLRKLCLKILTKQGSSMGSESKDLVSGVIFDAAWLWEEYLNTILKDLRYKHPMNKLSKGSIPLFENNKYSCYPDFYCKERGVVLDAKYKHTPGGEIDRNDLYQLISYIHILGSRIGALIYPSSKDDSSQIGTLCGGGDMHTISFGISTASDYCSFTEAMYESEEEFKKVLSSISI